MKKYIIFFTTLLFLTNCLIKEEDYSFIPVQDFFNNEQEAIYAVNACYAALGEGRTYGRYLSELLFSTTDIYSVNLTNARTPLVIGDITPTMPFITNPWNAYYRSIYRCNSVLKNVGNMPENKIKTEMKNRLFGEAFFLRAFCYFDLIRLWGGVPLRLTIDTDYNLARSSVEEIYSVVINDLQKAEKLLLPMDGLPSGENGRATRQAAQSLLARVYMTIAGNTAGSIYWDSTRIYAKKVIDYFEAEGYGLFEDEDYGLLFEPENETHPEHIFALQGVDAEGVGMPLADYTSITNYYHGSNIKGQMRLTQEFYDAIFDAAPNDKRIRDAIFHSFIDVNKEGEPEAYFWPTEDYSSEYNYDNLVTDYGYPPKMEGAEKWKYSNNNGIIWNYGPFMKKYKDETAIIAGQNQDNIPLIRYADILLMYAEAENEINPLSNEAFEKINLVRQRANVYLLNVVNTPSQGAFREAVLWERAVELFGECHRRFDLLRRERYVETMRSIGRNYTNKHKLYPISIDEMNHNTLILANNPGY